MLILMAGQILKIHSRMTQVNGVIGTEMALVMSGCIQGDSCPSQYGNSTIDRFGCIDNDGDGYSNSNDDFPDEPSQHQDSDGDGYGNNQTIGALMPDAFPTMQANGTTLMETVTATILLEVKEIGSQQIQTDGRIPIKMATQMRMMPSSMMLHSGMTVMAMDTEMRKVEIDQISFRWIQMSGRILTEMVMATTVMHFLQTAHNGTIPIMMVTEITPMEP